MQVITKFLKVAKPNLQEFRENLRLCLYVELHILIFYYFFYNQGMEVRV